MRTSDRVTTVRSETINELLGVVPRYFGHPIMTVDEWDWRLPLTEPDRATWEALIDRILGDADGDYQPWRD